MRIYKLFMITSAACLLAFVVSGPAQAQLQEVVDGYCAEVGDNVLDALEELGDASEDLADCSADFDQCLLGQGLIDEPSACIRDYKRCTKFGRQDQKQACQAFLLEWGNDTRRAEREAGREGVLPEFLDWIHGESSPVVDPTRDECLNAAQDLAVVCTDQQVGD